VTAALHIAHRELASFFRSSIGWVVIALFLLVSGVWVAFATLRPGEPASLRVFFGASQWLLLVVAPAISMRLLAEEWRSGTIEPLMASPAGDWAVAFGKYLGAVGFLVVMLFPTLAYVILLAAVSDPEYGPIITGYLGLILVGMTYIAVGMWMSSLTSNQVIAFLTTLFFFLLLWLASSEGARLLGPPWSDALYAVSIGLRVGDFAKGVIDTGHIVFFLAVSLLFIGLTVASLEVRRWR
jgi:ABC-2 type transport system permease protein